MKERRYDPSALQALHIKEFRAYFDTPAAYVVTVVMLLLAGYLFASPLFLRGQADLATFVENAPLLFLFFIPALTMRLYAEEFKTGTMEVLATWPVSDWEVLLAKYLGAMSVVTFLLGATTLYPLTLAVLGRPDWGAVAGAYLGLWLTAAALAAIGTWTSSLTRNQVVAFILAFLACFSLFLLGKIQGFLPLSWAPVADFLGLDSHLETISRGVVDSRDLCYYLSLAGFFLFLAWRNVLLRNAAGPSAAVAAALAAGLIALNAMSSRLYLRIDLSAGGLYSLSLGSRRLLSELPGPVEIRAYFSRELPPEYAAGRAYLRDLLKEYRTASGGKVRYRFMDLEKDEAAKKEALARGISPVQFNVISQEKYEVREALMGLSLEYKGGTQTLPVITKPEGLEYDLTSRLVRLTRPERKVIGALSTNGALGPERLHPRVLEALERNYEIRPVDLNDARSAVSVSSDVAGLLVLGPMEKLRPAQLYALDQFLLSGRPLVLALDGRRTDFQSFMATGVDTGLTEWLRHLGVGLSHNFVLDAQCEKVAVSQQRGWFTVSNIVPFPPLVVSTDLGREHPSTRHLESLVLPLVSPIELSGPAARPGRAQVLARSSKLSWLRAAWGKAPIFSVNPLSPLAPEPGDPRGPFILGVSLEDVFASFFSPEAKGDRGLPVKADPRAFRASGSGRLVVLGTSRFAAPDLPAGESGAVFLLNLVDWAAMDPELIAIRSKGSAFRPLQEIPPALKAAVRWLDILGPAFLVIGFGAFRLASRRKLRERRAALYGPPLQRGEEPAQPGDHAGVGAGAEPGREP